MRVSGVLVEGPRPNLVPPLRPLTDLRKLLMAVKRSLPMSAEARHRLTMGMPLRRGYTNYGYTCLHQH